MRCSFGQLYCVTSLTTPTILAHCPGSRPGLEAKQWIVAQPNGGLGMSSNLSSLEFLCFRSEAIYQRQISLDADFNCDETRTLDPPWVLALVDLDSTRANTLPGDCSVKTRGNRQPAR